MRDSAHLLYNPCLHVLVLIVSFMLLVVLLLEVDLLSGIHIGGDPLGLSYATQFFWGLQTGINVQPSTIHPAILTCSFQQNQSPPDGPAPTDQTEDHTKRL